ncbi:hypothetical protein J2Z39_000183 [Anaerococcus nagyae]|nr:hypothetical protein [Anaerococcus nagyae]
MINDLIILFILILAFITPYLLIKSILEKKKKYIILTCLCNMTLFNLILEFL